jgi:hypothetical protein
VPRQNGKNALLEIRELYGMVGRGEKILHTAHEVKTAQKHFRRLKFFFGQKADDPSAKFPELNALVENVRSVNGQEAIFLKAGGSIEVVARSKNSGRGFTVDVLVMDEAQEMSEDALEALMPTTSAAPLGNPQWIFTGTPPGPSAMGEVFTRVRAEALGDKPGRLAWHEWSASGEYSLDDLALWRATNPGLDSGRLQFEVIEGERSRFSDGGFARERLGVWAEDSSISGPMVELWSDLAVDEAPAGDLGAFAVAFSADGMRYSVAGALTHGDNAHVELISADVGSVDAGLAPLADWFTERVGGVSRWRRVESIVISGRAGAAVLAQLLKERGVSERRIVLPSTGQYFEACGALLERCRQGTISHLSTGQERLDESVLGAVQKQRTRDGAWGWEVPGGDETPVEAVSLALLGARTSRRGTPRRIY